VGKDKMNTIELKLILEKQNIKLCSIDPTLRYIYVILSDSRSVKLKVPDGLLEGMIKEQNNEDEYEDRKFSSRKFSSRLVLKLSDADRKEKIIESQIEKNVDIIKFVHTQDKPTKQQRMRKKIAVYRLYKNCNLTPKQIVEKTQMNITTVQNIIGKVFAVLCFNDDKCVFKPMLAPTVDSLKRKGENFE
jgi:hypothetical protein